MDLSFRNNLMNMHDFDLGLGNKILQNLQWKIGDLDWHNLNIESKRWKSVWFYERDML